MIGGRVEDLKNCCIKHHVNVETYQEALVCKQGMVFSPLYNATSTVHRQLVCRSWYLVARRGTGIALCTYPGRYAHG